jgi:hypothetical protein
MVHHGYCQLYIVCICITYGTTWLLTSQCRPLHCIISVTVQQWRGRTIICITYDTTCFLTTSQCRPLHCIISVTVQQLTGRTIPLRNIWKYVYCVIYGTEWSGGLNAGHLCTMKIVMGKDLNPLAVHAPNRLWSRHFFLFSC